MAAILHCIITDIENSRVQYLLFRWKTKINFENQVYNHHLAYNDITHIYKYIIYRYKWQTSVSSRDLSPIFDNYVNWFFFKRHYPDEVYVAKKTIRNWDNVFKTKNNVFIQHN